MCLAVPGKVIEVAGATAKVDFGGTSREVNVSLVEVAAGDYVAVHAGFAIEKIDRDAALESIRLWKELLDKDVQIQGQGTRSEDI